MRATQVEGLPETTQLAAGVVRIQSQKAPAWELGSSTHPFLSLAGNQEKRRNEVVTVSRECSNGGKWEEPGLDRG